MSVLSILQTIAIPDTGDTIYDGTYLYVPSNETLIAYTVNADNTLTEKARRNFKNGRIYYLAYDGTYIHCVTYGPWDMFACTFDGISFIQAGSVVTTENINNICANNNGEIFVTIENSYEVRRYIFNGSTYTKTHTVSVESNERCYGMACSTNYFVVCKHGPMTNNNVTLHNCSNASIQSEISLSNPDGVLILGDIVAVADDNSFNVYNIASGALTLSATIPVYDPNEIIDNIDYDGENNFHIYYQGSIQHAYYNGSSIILGETLALDGLRLYWNTSTYINGYFYVTHSTGEYLTGTLYVIQRETGIFSNVGIEFAIDGAAGSGYGTGIEFAVEGAIGSNGGVGIEFAYEK